MAGKAEILGIGQLQKSFMNLRQDMVLKTSRRMVAAAGTVLKKEAKAIAQSKGLRVSGALIRNIAIKRERNAPAGTEQYNLGVRHGRDLGNGKKVVKYFVKNTRGRIVEKRQNDPFYWRFLEFDTKFRKATSFIQQALENKRDQAIQAMHDRLTKDIERAGK